MSGERERYFKESENLLLGKCARTGVCNLGGDLLLHLLAVKASTLGGDGCLSLRGVRQCNCNCEHEPYFSGVTLGLRSMLRPLAIQAGFTLTIGLNLYSI
jgi:hypothetical protein